MSPKSVVDSAVLDALRTQEMAGERWAAQVRMAFVAVSVVGLAVTYGSNTPAASRAYAAVLAAFCVYATTLLVVLRKRPRYVPHLKYATIALDILFVYANTWPILLNHSGIYGIYRAPLVWTLLATFNALSGLRYSARASVFAGLLTVGLGAMQLQVLSLDFSEWTDTPRYVGVGLDPVSCVFTFLLAATPAAFAAVVAHQSRQLVVREAEQVMVRAAAEEQHRCAVQQVETLREVADAKDRFLGIASHELRTPVNALRATIELLQLAPETLTDPSSRERMTERLDRQSERLVKLIRQLLDSSKLGQSELALELAECDLVEICKHTLEGLEATAAARVEVHADGPVVGRWDASRLEQVVTNLIANALRYSSAETRVTVRVSADARQATLEVIDRGIGIPATQIDQVFTAFFRADNARTERRGLGLGLYITHEIVRRHAGVMRVHSQEGHGTTFTVVLPRTLGDVQLPTR